MVKSLGKSIINMYSMGACAALGISNQDALSEDLESDPFGSFLAPLSVGLITSRHYLCERNKNGGKSGTNGKEDEQKLMGSCSDPWPINLK